MPADNDQKLDTLLRVYHIKPGEWDRFLEVWRRIVVLRRESIP